MRSSLNLDGSGQAKLDTGLPFFEHMLDQVARHGRLDLDLHAKGDLEIDAHHTVEDVGITLGQAFAQAVGDKEGIYRYGYAYVPLDEALSRVVIDFSGRPGLEFRVQFPRARVGDFRCRPHPRVLPGVCEPCERDPACRQPVGVQLAPHRRDRVQGFRPCAAHRRHSRSPHARRDPVDQGQPLNQLPAPASRPVYRPSLPCAALP